MSFELLTEKEATGIPYLILAHSLFLNNLKKVGFLPPPYNTCLTSLHSTPTYALSFFPEKSTAIRSGNTNHLSPVKQFIMQTIHRSYFVAAALLIFSFVACKKTYEPNSEAGEVQLALRKASSGFIDNDMVMYWNDRTRVVLEAPMTPQACSRYYAMVQIAVHDAINSIKPKYERYALLHSRDKEASPDAAVASAAYHVITKLNLQGSFPVAAWYNTSLGTIPDGEAKQRGIALGEAAADAIITKRSGDNFLVANSQISLPDGTAPGAYRSTLPFSLPQHPFYLRKALDKWSTLTPFVLLSSSQFRVPPPDPVNSPEYTIDYNEVKTKGGRVGHTRTAEEEQIGKFWVENSTLGWNRMARTLITQKKMDAWRTARLFALMHTAMADASITNFESKYHYFYWRPETAIRLGDQDGNPQTVGDPTWLPGNTQAPNPQNPAFNLYTPPIPDYPSQHANYGGAAGEVMRRFFGTDNVSMSLTSTSLPNVTRHYSSLSGAIRDNSLSRIYVGYHFRKAVIEGEIQGLDVGRFVFENSFRESHDSDGN
jgi:hypothetical protein